MSRYRDKDFHDSDLITYEEWDWEDIEDIREDSGDGESELPRRKSPALRLVALVTAFAFIGLAAASFLSPLKSNLAGVVQESRELEKDINVQRLQRAVVGIDVLAGRSNSALSVEQKSGTGFNIDSTGMIVTNYHVIEGVKSMIIRFAEGEIYSTADWSGRPELDLAVIELKEEGLPTVPVNENPPGLGDKVRIVGNPLGLNDIVVEGTVEEYLRLKDKPVKVFSIDADVYPGNSGSPVFDRDGQVVGVVFARFEKEVEGEKETRGLAVPVREIFDF